MVRHGQNKILAMILYYFSTNSLISLYINSIVISIQINDQGINRHVNVNLVILQLLED